MAIGNYLCRLANRYFEFEFELYCISAHMHILNIHITFVSLIKHSLFNDELVINRLRRKPYAAKSFCGFP